MDKGDLKSLSFFLGGCAVDDDEPQTEENERDANTIPLGSEELALWKMTTGKAVGFNGVTNLKQFNHYMNQTYSLI